MKTRHHKGMRRNFSVHTNDDLAQARFYDEAEQHGWDRFAIHRWPFTAQADYESALKSAGWKIRMINWTPNNGRYIAVAQGWASLVLFVAGGGVIEAHLATGSVAAANSALSSLLHLFLGQAIGWVEAFVAVACRGPSHRSAWSMNSSSAGVASRSTSGS